MIKSLIANWKTTLLGLIAGFTGGSTAGWTGPDGSINWGAVILAVAIAALGALAKDHDVTGGTSAATPEAEKRIG